MSLRSGNNHLSNSQTDEHKSIISKKNNTIKTKNIAFANLVTTSNNTIATISTERENFKNQVGAYEWVISSINEYLAQNNLPSVDDIVDGNAPDVAVLPGNLTVTEVANRVASSMDDGEDDE